METTRGPWRKSGRGFPGAGREAAWPWFPDWLIAPFASPACAASCPAGVHAHLTRGDIQAEHQGRGNRRGHRRRLNRGIGIRRRGEGCRVLPVVMLVAGADGRGALRLDAAQQLPNDCAVAIDARRARDAASLIGSRGFRPGDGNCRGMMKFVIPGASFSGVRLIWRARCEWSSASDCDSGAPPKLASLVFAVFIEASWLLLAARSCRSASRTILANAPSD